MKTYPWTSKRPLAGPRRCPTRGAVVAAALFVLAAAGLFGAATARAATYNAWTAQSPGVNTTWYGDWFPDASNGWLVGSAGNVRHTTNGGTSWAAQTSGTTQNLRGVAFVGAQNGWAVGSGGVVLHTTNGGTSWTAQTSGVTGTIYGVSFVDANTGWFCTTGGVVRKTTNGGTTWTAQTTGITSTVYGVCFTDANTGWLITTGGGVRKTTNGGTSWTAETSGSTQTLRGIYFVNSSVGWVTGNTGNICHTTNGGTSWTELASGTQTLYGVYATDTANAWAVGGGGTITHTSNSGSSWAAQTSSTTQALRDVCGAGGSLWACGAGGTCLTYLIDSTPPVTTATNLQSSATTGWQTAGQTVTLSATDAQSGVSATYYRIDGGAQTTYSAPFTISTQGSHSVVYWSVDKGGNTEASHTGYVNIDATAPVTTASGLQLAANTGWQTTAQPVTLSATDGVSGVATTNYTLDGGAVQLYAGGPFLVSGSGSHTITYWSVDNAGNIESPVHVGYVNIDTTAPVTTATGLQANGSTGWQNVSQVVSLAGNDPLSGVAATYYTIDGGGQQTYTSPFTIATQGSHKVTYWSVDGVGNKETAGAGYVNIDLASPTVADDSDGLWHHTAVIVHLSPSDTGGSGLAGTQYRLQGSSTWSTAAGNAFTVAAPADHSADGVHVYQYRALDNAGNSSPIGSCTVWIDTMAPVTTAVGLAADDLSGWRTTSQTVSLAADDGSGSGVASISYTVDGGSTQTYSTPFTVSGTGQHPVTYWATDAAGNVESVHTGWVNISNPYAQATGLAATSSSNWQDGPATVTITGTGDHAPISVTYGVDTATPQTAAGNPTSFTVNTQGSHPVVFWATNNVGVDSFHETGYVNLDLTSPVTTANGLQSSATTGWSTTGVTVTLTPSDTGGSGLSSTWYTVDGGAAQLYTGPFLVMGDGSHPVTYWSVDVAGNVETHDGTHNTGYVNIDSTPPATTATNLQADQHSGWVGTAQTVTLTATDAGSGTSGGSAATYYTVDGGGQQTYSGPFSVSGAGSHAVVYWSVDAVGNTESHHTGYVNIDATPPTTTATNLQASAGSGWVGTAQTVSLSASDATSGMSGGAAATYYTVDGGGQQTYTGPFQVSGDASHTITYWSVDAAGNAESPHNVGYVNIDATAPVTTPTGLQSSASSGWTNAAQVSVSLSASDATSGMSGGSAATYYTVDGGATQTYSGAFTVSAEGSHTITYWSVDAAGNIETHDATHDVGYVNIDRTAPATTATGLQSSASSGWQNTSQTVSLAATDALSGAATTYYKLDSQAVQTYANPFGVSGQGSHTILYWSVDAAGNVESQNTGYVNIDATAPTVSDNADGAWHNQAVTVTLTPHDAGGSGVAKTQYRLQGSSTWLDTTSDQFTVPAPADGSGDGANVYEYRALDNAGNPSATGTCTVKIDTQGPVVTATGLQVDDLTGWQIASQQVTLTATDAGSGVAHIYYTVDGGAQTTYTGPFTISNAVNISHVVVYWAVDALGNVTAQKTGYVNISNPYAQATNLAPDATSGWHNAATTVQITGSGDHTPITVSYSTNGGTTWTTVASPASVTFSTQGSHAISYYATNSVSVQSVHQSGYCNIDLAKPTTAASGLQASATTGWQTSSQTVTLTPTDTGGSGLASTTYTVDGSAATPYTTPFTISANGSHPVTYFSTDNAGNVETTHTGYVNIDTQAPTTAATNLQANATSGWVTNATPVSVTLTPSDSESGMSGGSAATYYTLDGGDQATYSGAFTVSGDGQHQVTYWSVDNLGNAEAVNTGWVNIDTTAPATTATNLVASASTGWQNGPVTVTLSATDAVSGVGSTFYTIDGGATQTYSAPFTVSAEGAHHITYWSVDAAGNTETAGSGYANIDTTAPTVTDNAGTAWHDTADVVTLAASDGSGSGVAATQYRPQGSQTWLATSGNTFTVAAPADHSNDGSHAYEYRALDNAGNVSTTGTCTVNIDTRVPTTSALGLQANNHSGWQNTAQTVTLTGNDGTGSGVASTSYNLNGGATQSYGTPFQVATTGSTTVGYWSVDNAGNSEPANLGYVNIDQALPTVTDDADAAWHNSDVVVQLTPADTGGSGVAGTQYRLQGSQTWLAAVDNAFTVPAASDGSGDGAHVYEYEATDNAGNTSSLHTCTVKIDTQAPQTTTTDLQANASTGWQTSSQVVHLSATDAGAGVAHTYYTLDGGARQTYTGAFTVSGSKSHRIVYWSVDAIGNIETPHIGFVNIDAVAPVTSATNLAASSSSGWVNTPQLVSLTPSDDLSGVAATTYTIDGGAQQTYTGPFTISTDGQHAVTYWSTDNAGNTETVEHGYVNIDTTAPTTTATGLQPDSLTGWQTAAQTVTLTASDGTGAVSGLSGGTAGTFYTVDGGAQQTYSGPFQVSGAASHTIVYWSVDAAGNVEQHDASHDTGYVNISNPYAQSSGLNADAGSGWHTGPASATITASGSNSPFTISYSIDGGSVQTAPTGSDVTIDESTDGSHRIVFWSTNAVNVQSVHETGYLNVDQTPPVTTAATAGSQALQTDDHSGWVTTAQTVTLSPADATSGMSGGVAATYYTVDGGTPQTYSGPFQVSGDGSHAVDYWSVDAAGNAEQHEAGYVNIDGTPPTVGDDSDGAWHNAPVTVTVAADDGTNGSGVAVVQYRLQGASTWSTATNSQFVVPAPSDGSNDGVHAYEYQATDNAGNTSATGTCSVKIDTQGPVVTNDADAYWHNTAVAVHLQATDSGAGVSAVDYRLQGATSWTPVSGDQATVNVPLPTDGQPHSSTYEYAATDALGNATAIATFTVNIDPSVPNTIIHGLPTSWVNHAVSLTFTATPGTGAPIVRTEYSRDGGATWTQIATGQPLPVTTAGVTTILYRSANAAGTVEDPPRSATVRIDLRRPSAKALRNATITHNKVGKLSYRVADSSPSCGYAKVTITIYLKKKVVKRIVIKKAAVNRNLVYTYKAKLKRGAYTWKVSAVDLAGNKQTSKLVAKKLTIR